MDRDRHICIVGAGAAGLTAAYELAKKGYRRVTVLEKEDRVGGKCHTIKHEGRTYELGAAVFSNAYATVMDVMRDLRVSGMPASRFMHVDFQRATCRKARFYYPLSSWLRLAPSLVALVNQLRKHRGIFRPGWADIDPDLMQPFAAWTKGKGLGSVAKALAACYTNFGFGYYEEVAAAYVLKYITLIRPPLRELPTVGYGGLWEQVAQRFDVRRNCPAISIARGDVVRVRTCDGTLECDVLILACPLDDSLRALDASPEECELFSRIRYYDYHMFAAFAEGLSPERYAFIRGIRPGRAACWYRRWLDRNLCIFCSLGRSSVGMRETMDHDEIRANIEEDLARLGGRITGYHTEHVWKMFPHVTPEDFANGYYDRLESLQGKNKTYYIGELLGFPTVETVAAYSRNLVETHFR
jgi:hypothetical protein